MSVGGVFSSKTVYVIDRKMLSRRISATEIIRQLSKQNFIVEITIVVDHKKIEVTDQLSPDQPPLYHGFAPGVQLVKSGYISCNSIYRIEVKTWMIGSIVLGTLSLPVQRTIEIYLTSEDQSVLTIDCEIIDLAPHVILSGQDVAQILKVLNRLRKKVKSLTILNARDVCSIVRALEENCGKVEVIRFFPAEQLTEPSMTAIAKLAESLPTLKTLQVYEMSHKPCVVKV